MGIVDITKVRPVIIFDFGGVIGGTDFHSVAKELVLLLDLTENEAFTLIEQSQQWKRSGQLPDLFWRGYAQRTGRALPSNWIAQFEQIKRLAIRYRPEMVALVDHLRKSGYSVALFSNVTEARAEYIRQLGVYDHFDCVVLSCDIGVGKPNSQAFAILLERLGVEGAECLYIDNNSEHLVAAEEYGIKGVLFHSFEELKKELQLHNVQCSFA